MLLPVLIACGVIIVISIIIGVTLGFLSEKFKVHTDEREEKIRACLAGSNCGACGYAGCDAYAKAIVFDNADPGLCGASDHARIGEIMGVSVDPGKKKIAYVRCSGNCNKTIANYNFDDTQDCRVAFLAPGHGSKKCPYGCCGYGTCAAVCPYDAIRVVDGLAVVDGEKCQACGKCVAVCPNHLIEIIPYDAKYVVRCSSHNKGKSVRSACSEGCIGCGLCMKVCETGAIQVVNNLALIDQEKCVGCGKCAEKCPSKIIVKRHE
ncbi:MAG: RnfABCDGE type electron transport complex subunit B [Clostridia bacterium]|nr:RnfABCDGE type electron transport complex subunit B [Clostridia bacterium]